jgi:flagellar motor switch/type III secretory pathway protein FliN
MDGVETQAPNSASETGGRDLVREFAWLPLELALETPLSDFAVRDLLFLRDGTVVRSAVALAGDIPLLVNGKLIAWAKLEVSKHHLAARITELA